MITPLLIICVSTYLIWKASSSFDVASSYLTRNLSEGIKGPTVNAIASSLPELLISFFFLFYIGDLEGFSAGYATIIGSSIFNIAVIPTLSFLIIYYKKGIPLFPTDKKIIEQDGFFLIATELALFVGLYFGGISIYLALILILFYCLYIFLVFRKRNNNMTNDTAMYQEEGSEDVITDGTIFKKIITVNIAGLVLNKQRLNTYKASLILLVSLVIISIACKELVTSSEHLSKQLNMNLFFITFFVAAVASSIPDTILSIKDAKNEKYKDAFSNAYGSNIFDICIGIGLPVLCYLWINDMDVISTVSSDNSNNIVLISSILLIAFSIPITLIYWLKSVNLYRALFIIGLYLSFIGIVFYLS
jgi:Ca2+/Na+ antiporter